MSVWSHRLIDPSSQPEVKIRVHPSFLWAHFARMVGLVWSGHVNPTRELLQLEPWSKGSTAREFAIGVWSGPGPFSSSLRGAAVGHVCDEMGGHGLPRDSLCGGQLCDFRLRRAWLLSNILQSYNLSEPSIANDTGISGNTQYQTVGH